MLLTNSVQHIKWVEAGGAGTFHRASWVRLCSLILHIGFNPYWIQRPAGDCYQPKGSIPRRWPDISRLPHRRKGQRSCETSARPQRKPAARTCQRHMLRNSTVPAFAETCRTELNAGGTHPLDPHEARNGPPDKQQGLGLETNMYALKPFGLNSAHPLFAR